MGELYHPTFAHPSLRMTPPLAVPSYYRRWCNAPGGHASVEASTLRPLP
jgi:hypothetical protein